MAKTTRSTPAARGFMPLKDSTHTMQYPFTVLHAGDMKPRIFEHKRTKITFYASSLGHATVHDEDILIYVLSRLNQVRSDGGTDLNSITVRVVDLLKAIGRPASGKSRANLEAALRRIGTMTAIVRIARVNGGKTERNFSLINYTYIDRKPGEVRGSTVQLSIHPWMRREVFERNMLLTLPQNYFEISEALDKRLYLMGRQRRGAKREFEIPLADAHARSGSVADLREFRRKVKAAAARDRLPEFTLTFNAKADELVFKKRPGKTKRTLGGAPEKCVNLFLVEKRENRFSSFQDVAKRMLARTGAELSTGPGDNAEDNL